MWRKEVAASEYEFIASPTAAAHDDVVNNTIAYNYYVVAAGPRGILSGASDVCMGMARV